MVCARSPAFTVIVALREDVEVFSVTLTVTVASFEPDDVLTLHQVWLLVTDQEVLEVMVKESFPLEASNVKLLLFNCSVTLAPDCVTVMFCDCSPALTVMVAVRESMEVFSDTLTVIVPLFDPEKVLTVHQSWSLVIVHEVLEVMVKVPVPLVDSNVKLVLFSCSVGLVPACVTAMVCDCSPAFTVIVALREDVVLFSETLTVIVPFFEPEEVLTVHHVWSLVTVHEMFEVIVKESLLSAAVNDRSFLFSWRSGLAPA